MSEADLETPGGFTVTGGLTITDGITVTGGTIDFSGASSSNALTLTDLSATTAAAGATGLAYDNTTGAFTYTPPDLSTYLTNATLTGSDLDMGGNKVLFANMYSAEGNLPSATTYHGMFAHVHGTGKGYFAHNGNWVKLIDETSSTTDNLTEGSTNLYYTDARARAAVSATTGVAGTAALSYNSSTGQFTLTPPDLSSYATTASLATVATSGAYSDLTGTPSLSGYLTDITGESLSDLSNVASTAPTDGQVLTYDTTNGWQPETPASAGIALSDLSVSTATASGSGSLAYDNTTGVFTFTPAASSGGGSVNYIASDSTGSATASGSTSLAVGDGSVASGLRSLAVGFGADSTASYTVSLGHFAEALGQDGVALGYDTNIASTYTGSAALGRGATVTASNQLMLGQANTSGFTSIRVGNTSYSPSDNYDLATKKYVDDNSGGLPSNFVLYGTGTASANTTDGIAIGNGSNASGATSVSIGVNSTASGQWSTAYGRYSSASGYLAQCFGSGSYAQGHTSFAAGQGAGATHQNSTALGFQARAQANNTFTLGNLSISNLKCQDTSISATSDYRDKVQIEDLTIGLSFVNAITPKAFYKNNRANYYTPVYTIEELYDDPTLKQSFTVDEEAYQAGTEKWNQREFGFVSQDVAAQLPEEYADARVSYNEYDDLYEFDVQHFTMGDMTPILWNAVRELSDRHDQLQADYDALLARVVALENA